MTTGAFHLDGVEIGAADLDDGVRRYRLLLGIEPVRLHSGAWRFQLDRGALEIAPGANGLRALRFTQAGDAPHEIDFHGLAVRVTPVVAPPDALPQSPARGGAPSGVADVPAAAASLHAIDHVVVLSTDLERAIALWRDRLGLRLALDREFPARGLRMLFFRSAGMTLELVSAIGPSDARGSDRLDGVAYQVRDLPACRARLAADGFDVSEVRDGHKRGTRVATVRSGTLGVPTLLIEHVDRGA